MTVFAGCLTQQGADGLTEKARHLPGKVDTLLLDVTSDESVIAAVHYVESKTSGLWGIVINAGILGTSAPTDWLAVKHYQQCMDVNVLGVVRVTEVCQHCERRQHFNSHSCSLIQIFSLI